MTLWFLDEVLLGVLILEEVGEEYSQFCDPRTHVLQSDRRIIVSSFDIEV